MLPEPDLTTLLRSPGRDAWRALLNAVVQEPGQLTRVTEALKAWPDALREAPIGQWSKLGAGAPAPVWWPLVRSLELTEYEELRPVELLGEIRILRLGARPGRIDAAELAALPRLETLDVGGATTLRLDELPALPRLRTLQADAVRDVHDLRFLAQTPALRELFLADCVELRNLEGIEAATQLEQLHLTRCAALSNLDALRGHPALRFVDLRWAGAFAPAALAELPRLEHLWLSADRPERLLPLRTHAALRHLLIAEGDRAPSLADLTGSGITHLTLERCPFAALPESGALPALTHLTLHALRGAIPPLSSLPRLEQLHIQATEALRDLDFIAGAHALTHLYISGCDRLEDVRGLALAPALRTVRLDGAAPAVLAAAARLTHAVPSPEPE